MVNSPTMDEALQPSIEIENLNFSYGGPPILRNLSLSLPPGSRCLLGDLLLFLYF
jgi:CCR4-NOT complex subunit CAF16